MVAVSHSGAGTTTVHISGPNVVQTQLSFLLSPSNSAEKTAFFLLQWSISQRLCFYGLAVCKASPSHPF